MSPFTNTRSTSLVVFETLYKDGKELAVHADIEDENQTVKVKIPEIGTKATVDGKKEVTASGRVKIEDTVSYKNLTPGKEYTCLLYTSPSPRDA